MKLKILLQALLGIKVEPKETLEEVKEEEGLENLRWGLTVEEEENQRKWAAERERRMALDYYVDMAFTSGGVPKNFERKRKRKSETEEEGVVFLPNGIRYPNNFPPKFFTKL